MNMKLKLVITSILVWLVFPFVSNSQAGLLDISFGNLGIVQTDIANANDYGFSTVVQPDGKIIVVGIGMVDTIQYNNFVVIRYKTNGSLDSTFGTNGIVTTDFYGGTTDEAISVCLQPNGKIIVAGKSESSSNMIDFAIARYNSDGSLDLTFVGDGKVTTDIAGENDYGSCVKIQNDGKIVLAGYSGNALNNKLTVVRYNPNGSLDNTFDGDGITTTQVGYIYLYAQSLAIQADGKIVATASSGSTPSLNYQDILVVRYNTDGSLDTTFDHDGVLLADFCYQDYANCVSIQTDGRILVTGRSYDTINTLGNNLTLLRFNSNGSLDTTFNGSGKVITDVTTLPDHGYSIAVQGNGKIVVVGHSFDGVGDFKIILVRYNPDGSLDNTFDNDGLVITNITNGHEYGESVTIQSDGKIVVTGFVYDGFSTYDIFVARYIGDIPYPLSIQQSSNNTNITFSPNPFSEKLIIESDIGLNDATLRLYNLLGQNVKEVKQLSGHRFVLYRDLLEAGIYFIVLNEGDKIITRKKIMITQ